MNIGQNRFYINYITVDLGSVINLPNNKYVVLRSNEDVYNAKDRTYEVYEITDQDFTNLEIEDFEFIHNEYYYKIQNNKVLLRLRTTVNNSNNIDAVIQGRDNEDYPYSSRVIEKNKRYTEFKLTSLDPPNSIVKEFNVMVFNLNNVTVTQHDKPLVQNALNIIEEEGVYKDVSFDTSNNSELLNIYTYNNRYNKFYFNNVPYDIAKDVDIHLNDILNPSFKDAVAIKAPISMNISYSFYNYNNYIHSSVEKEYNAVYKKDNNIIVTNAYGEDVFIFPYNYLGPYFDNTFPQFPRDNNDLIYIEENGTRFYNFVYDQFRRVQNGVLVNIN